MRRKDLDNQLMNTKRIVSRVPESLWMNQRQLQNMAKVRIFQDQLMQEKIKNSVIDRKLQQQQQNIEHLQYTVNDLKNRLIKSHQELVKYSNYDEELNAYSTNLREAGQQLITLNEIVLKKTKETQKLIQINSKVKQDNNKLQIRVKQLERVQEQQKNKIKDILALLQLTSQSSFQNQILSDLTLVEQQIHQMTDNLSKVKQALQKNRKEGSEIIMKNKQKILSLEYALKLAEQRNNDFEKKKNLQSSFIQNRNCEVMIEQMLKKQEELSLKIGQLEEAKESLLEELDSMKSDHLHLVDLHKKDFENEIKNAKDTIKTLILEKAELSEKLERTQRSVSQYKSRETEKDMQISKQLREYCEQNKRLKLQLNNLESDNRMLQKQMRLRNLC